MTKGEIRKARREARAAGLPLTGELALAAIPADHIPLSNGRSVWVNPDKPRRASRSEQHARYLDCGPGAWDDR